MASDLPPELLHLILAPMEHGPQLRTTLFACSTVSHLWRDVALPYLFSSLKARRRESFADVVAFLSTHPHIAACVKRLWLQRAGPPASPSKPEIDHDTVHALLVCLPALVDLTFHTVKFVDHCIQGAPVPMASHPPPDSSYAGPIPRTDQMANGPYRLQLVYLYGCVAPEGPTPLFRILSLCEIDTLRATLNQLPGTDVAQVDLSALHRPLRVHRLRVGVQKRPAQVPQRPPPLLEALHRTIEPGCLRELDVTLHTWDDVKTAGALLRNAGNNFAALRLDVCWDSESGEGEPASLLALAGGLAQGVLISMGGLEGVVGDRWRALNLSECPKLEMFEFEFPSWDSILPDRSGNACAKIVRLLPAGTRCIVLRLPELMHEAVPEYPRTPGLREVEQAVLQDRQRRFPELTRVVLAYVDYNEAKFERWSSISSRVMPRLLRERLLYAAVCGR